MNALPTLEELASLVDAQNRALADAQIAAAELPEGSSLDASCLAAFDDAIDAVPFTPSGHGFGLRA